MQTITVGSIVEAMCGKCNDIMGHAVVVIVAGNIAKVECRACRSVHRFRPAGKSAMLPTATPAPKSRATPSRAKSTALSAPKTTSALRQWQVMSERRGNDTPIPYSTGGSFAPKDLIEHPTFGLGEVVACIQSDKIDVLFETGVRRLMCNKR